jgi:PadR family transcriptional regulator PadR
VYPALRRLEASALISGGWSEAAGRRRRVYALTDVGRDALAGRRAAWRDFAAAVDAALTSSGCPPE